jgi:hypothetical protein
MISKRRKTTTLRKKYRKCSNRVRRLHRMKMRGGVFPDDKISLTEFNGIENLKLEKPEKPIDEYSMSSSIVKDRNVKLIEFKQNLDSFLSGLGDNKSYTRENFHHYVTQAIEKDTIFRKYSSTYNDGTDIQYPTAILPIILEYLHAGFTLEQLLRAEFEYITIDKILLAEVPNIREISNPFKRSEQTIKSKKNVLSDRYDDKLRDILLRTMFQSISVEIWTEENNVILRKTIKDAIFDKLCEDTNPSISPAQFIKMGFSKEYLETKETKESATGIDISKLKTYGFLSVWELKKAGFTDDVKLKNAGFTANDFKKSKYTLRQLINLGFTKEELESTDIIFTDSDFPPNITYTLVELTTVGFDAKRIFDIKMSSFPKYNNYGSYNREREREREEHRNMLRIEHIKAINTYLKSIGFNAQNLYAANISVLKDYYTHRQDLSNILLSLLIVAGFTYDEIKTLGMTNEQIYDAIKFLLSSYLFRGFKILYDIKSWQLRDLKEIGFLPIDLVKLDWSSISSYNPPNFRLDAVERLKTGGFSAKDFQMGHVSQLHYSHKPSALIMKQAGFTLQELIDSRKQIQDDPKYKSDFGIVKFGFVGYDLMELKGAGYDLINPQDYNVVNIFKTGAYTYGEIKKVVDEYAENVQNKGKLEILRTQLTALKDVKKKDGDSMCKRSMGFLNRKGTTDPNCKYDANLVLHNL